MLFSETEKAKALAKQSVDLKTVFQEQTYTKFCNLLNSKKREICRLNDTIKNINGSYIVD